MDSATSHHSATSLHGDRKAPALGHDSVSRAPALPSESGSPGIAHWCAPTPPGPISNVFTVDLEDWPIAVLGPDHAITTRVVENTKRCLQILAWHQVKATFFILTKVAERFPDLVHEVQKCGHEIASHGHAHELLTDISPRHFESDVRRSIDILEAITGRRPYGYRAPAFSVVSSTRWAGPILADLGFKYSSSIFPIRHRRYGIANELPGIHRWSDCGLIECPPASLPLLGRNWPVAGGGYFRLLPGPVARAAIRKLNRRSTPAVLYMHPYELDPRGVQAHKDDGETVSPLCHVTQSLFRNRMEARLHRLFESFRFTTLENLLQHAV